MDRAPSPHGERVRAAEIVAALSLATDLATGLPLEHGLQSTLVAMRLCDRLGVDAATAAHTYHASLLFYVGCTADAEVAAEVFGDDLHTHLTPVLFGSRREMLGGLVRALSPPEAPPAARAARVVRRLPSAARGHRQHLVAICEVGVMLTDRVGLPEPVHMLFAGFTERWDGKGAPSGARGEEIPLPVRIAHVARDATFQCTLAGAEHAAGVVRARAGGAFDPEIASALADGAAELLAPVAAESVWQQTLDCEPAPHLTLEGPAIDRALSAMGDFADLACPYLVGHSAGVAELAAAAATRCGFDADDVTTVRRAALVHDVGRVAVPVRIWQKPTPLTSDEWERIRLHAYHSERVLAHSSFLAALAPVATAHHERLDGSGYHRGTAAAALSPAACVLAAADAYHAMTEPRPHREALEPDRASQELAAETSAGRLDANAVEAVLDAAGAHVPRIERPAGLTDREAEVVGLLARGLQTKQVAVTLGISSKTADRHIQNAYGKIGVSTRAAATLFAMEHGLAAWGELPMARGADRS